MYPRIMVMGAILMFFPVPGWGSTHVQGFGEDSGVKNQIFNLIRSIRTVMKCKS